VKNFLNPLVQSIRTPPIEAVARWLPTERALALGPPLDVAQAVPNDPPPLPLREYLAQRLRDDGLGAYTEIAGLPPLRKALADHMAGNYGGTVNDEDVIITAGCNQAFCLAISALAGPGDEVILPVPYYFNHQMWLEMMGIHVTLLPCQERAGVVPDPEAAEALITPRTRAIVLVTPNNPTGAEYPSPVLEHFLALCHRRNLALILDETYKDFRNADSAPHRLFQDPDWRRTLVQLYSFSKAYNLPGYRVGSLIAGPPLREAVEKIVDCMTICAPRIGQEAALYGLTHLGSWVRENAQRIHQRRLTLEKAFAGHPYALLSVGAYFGYVRHPFQAGSPRQGQSPESGTGSFAVARRLAEQFGVTCLPGEIFGPGQNAYLRLAFANLAEARIPELARRLAASAPG